MSRVHSMTYETVKTGSDTDYVAVCACGFESLPLSNPFDVQQEQCDVLQAEIEGARRRRRRAERQQLAISA
jgi:hypothetical protein